MHRALLFLYAETPVHVGGDASLGALDLPIQREVTTGLPIIKAESLKGALRERFRPPSDKTADRKRWREIFGDEPPATGARQGELKPGTLRVHEAQLVAFPVPAMTRTFVWATSPLARARLDRKASLAGVSVAPPDGSGPPVSPGAAACLASGGPAAARFVLGPYVVEARRDDAVRNWAARLAKTALPDPEQVSEMTFFAGKLVSDLFVCSDELLGALSRDCAPVVARVQLGTGEDDTPRKTVKHGPFYSEYLPAETILAALLECDNAGDLAHVRDGLQNKPLRIGGDETLGKGLMWCRLPDREAAEDQNHHPERTEVTVTL